MAGSERSVDLPGVAANVPAGQKLYLVVSPVSDMFAANGSRTPGGIVLRNTRVQLPLVVTPSGITPKPGPVAPEDTGDGDTGDSGEKDKKQKKDDKNGR